MNVVRAAGVVAGDQSVELDCAIGVGYLDAPEEGRVEVGGVAVVAIAVGGDAGVDSCRVAV
jgi:hypothetical protein